MVGFCNSDWCGDKEDTKGISGSFFNFQSVPISWCFKKQLIVALSSSEAWYRAVAHYACQEILLKSLIVDLSLSDKENVQLFLNNQSTIELVNNLVVVYKRSKVYWYEIP